MWWISCLLLAAILLAREAPNHSPALKRFFDVQLLGNLAIETGQYMLGWQSPAYTIVYDGFTLMMFAASAGVVWEAWKTSASSQKASLPQS